MPTRNGSFPRDASFSTTGAEINFSNWIVSGTVGGSSAPTMTMLGDQGKQRGFAAGVNGIVTASWVTSSNTFEVPLAGGFPSQFPSHVDIQTIFTNLGATDDNVKLKVQGWRFDESYPHIKIGIWQQTAATSGTFKSTVPAGLLNTGGLSGSILLCGKQNSGR